MFFIQYVKKKDAFMGIVKSTCTALCLCPLLMACHASQEMQNLTAMESIDEDIQEESIVWNLSPSAQFTYNTLLFNMATLQDDVNLGVEAIANMEVLVKNHHIVPDLAWYNDASVFLFTHHEKELAQSILRKGIELYPEDSTLTLLFAEASSTLQKRYDAVTGLEAFYTKNPHNAEIRLELIKAYIANKQFAEAEETLKSIPAKEFTAILHYYYAKAALGLQNIELAKKHLTQTIAIEPSFSEAYAELAYLYETQKDYANAERIYKGLMDLEASNVGLWVRIFTMNIMLDNPQNAYAMALKGVSVLDKSNPHETTDFMLRAARTFLEAKYFLQAHDMFYAITERKNAPQEAYFLLGAIAYEQFKKHKEALQYLEHIEITSEYHSRTLLLRAQIQYELGQRKTALEIVEHALALYPDLNVFHDMHAQIYINAKQYTKALSIIDEALERWPDDGDFLTRRGSILEMMGKSDEAFVAMEKALVHMPENSVALNYIAYSWAEKNQNLDQALEYAEKAIHLDPASGHIMDTLAWVQYKRGDMAEALANIRKALMLGADEAEIWEHYGDIALANGESKIARKAYKEALSKRAGDEHEAVLRAKIEKLDKL